MDKQTFIHKFQLNTLAPSLHKFRYSAKTRSAAVLIPLIDEKDCLSIIFTKRASHLKHHAGQISFPGGKVEKSDADIVMTALREAEEEIGLCSSKVQIIGQLTPYHTITGFNVTPVVGLVDGPINYLVDEGEVAEVFTVPLSHFLHKKQHIKVATYHKGNKHQVHFMPYQHYNIWGATAAMLADLVAHINN